MPRYTQEQKAQAVAEYWLTGSALRVAETFEIGSHHTVQDWVSAAEAPKTASDQRVRARAETIHELRQTTAEQLYQRALDLQLRDLAAAEFGDRTRLLKVLGQQVRLSQGKPTDIHEHRTKDPMDLEIAELLDREAAKRAAEEASSNGHG